MHDIELFCSALVTSTKDLFFANFNLIQRFNNYFNLKNFSINSRSSMTSFASERKLKIPELMRIVRHSSDAQLLYFLILLNIILALKLRVLLNKNYSLSSIFQGSTS